MDKKLLEQLARITPEEERILQGQGVDMGVYSETRKNAVDAAKLVGEQQLIAIRPHTRFAAFPRHRHDFVEIMYVCQGKVAHKVGERTLTLGAGELLFLGRNTWHEVLPAGQGDIAVNFLVRPAFFRTAFDLMEQQNVLSDFIIDSLAGEGAADDYLYFPVAGVPPVQNLVENLLYSLCRAPDAGGRLDQLTMGLLFLQLLRAAEKAETRGGTPRTLALRALGYIDAHYQSATLRQFARENGIPEYTASRLIKRQLGSSFRDLLMEKRFSAAVQLLERTRLPAAEILALVGYENTSHFYRLFQQRYHITPRQYRAGRRAE